MWFVYILFCNQEMYYTGMTDNLERRFFQHKNKQSKFTSKFNSVELVYTENLHTRNLAEKREKQIKGWSKAKKKALIDGNKDLLIQLSKST